MAFHEISTGTFSKEDSLTHKNKQQQEQKKGVNQGRLRVCIQL